MVLFIEHETFEQVSVVLVLFENCADKRKQNVA